MSANLNKTKRRINSINSTKKLTKAMELVATVKLRKFKNEMLKNQAYVLEIESLLSKIVSSLDQDDVGKYKKENSSSNEVLYVVINSNLGLCASYNNDVFKFVESNVSKENTTILSIGTKGFNEYEKNGYKVNGDFVNVNEKISYDEVVRLGKYLLSAFENKKYKSIHVVYTKYINSIKFIPQDFTLFPIQENKKDENKKEAIFDPDSKTMIEQFLPIYINSSLFNKIIESQVCEQATRMTAMENATDNADEIISELVLEYNKARQAAITQEISEVVSGQISK